ncbi:MAG: hypothetical protein Q8R72_04390 [Hylemonella sp.]|nr:hypothetical protein [Hylemonella sp.]
MLKYASWIHGNAVQLEDPSGILVKKVGMGTEMQFNTLVPGISPPGTWCHIAIPSPVIVNDARLKLQKVFLLFQTGQHAAIDNLHIFDGPRRIFMQDVVPGRNSSARRTGNHMQAIDAQNTFTLPAPVEISFGVSISFTFRPVALTTSLGRADPEGKLLITTAGADFV